MAYLWTWQVNWGAQKSMVWLKVREDRVVGNTKNKNFRNFILLYIFKKGKSHSCYDNLLPQKKREKYRLRRQCMSCCANKTRAVQLISFLWPFLLMCKEWIAPYNSILVGFKGLQFFGMDIISYFKCPFFFDTCLCECKLSKGDMEN